MAEEAPHEEAPHDQHEDFARPVDDETEGNEGEAMMPIEATRMMATTSVSGARATFVAGYCYYE